MIKDKPTLLLVDDEIIDVAILLEILGEDYNVRVATDSASALHSVDTTPPDLILLDVVMPGMDGFELCRSLKETANARDIPVIFLTARDAAADETLGLELGAADYITKPFNPDIVKLRVRKHVQLKIRQDHMVVLAKQQDNEVVYLNFINEKLRTKERREL